MTDVTTARANAFEPSGTERLVRETADAVFAELGDNTKLVALECSDTGLDRAAWGQMSNLGWPAFALAEDAGGGGSIVEVGQLVEAVGWAAYPSPLLQVTGAAVLAAALGDGCGPAAALAAEIVGGAVVVPVVPFAEPLLRLTAGRLAGTPAIVEWAQHAETLAVLCPDEDAWGLTTLPAATVADRIRPARSLDNERIAVVDLDGVAAPDVVRLDAAVADGVIDRLRLLRAAEMTGGAARTLALTRDYMLERHQFGVPLGSFQAVQHHLANMRIDVDAALLTVREGLSLAELGGPTAAAAAIAGFVAGRSATRVTITAAQLFGGVGAITEHRLHHHFRRARAMQLRLGPVPVQQRRVMQTAVLGDPPGPWRTEYPRAQSAPVD